MSRVGLGLLIVLFVLDFFLLIFAEISIPQSLYGVVMAFIIIALVLDIDELEDSIQKVSERAGGDASRASLKLQKKLNNLEDNHNRLQEKMRKIERSMSTLSGRHNISDKEDYKPKLGDTVLDKTTERPVKIVEELNKTRVAIKDDDGTIMYRDINDLEQMD